MKNFLKKLHIGPSHPPDDVDPAQEQNSKAPSSLSNWLNSVTNKHPSTPPYPPSSSSPSPSPSPSPWETGRTRRVSQSTPPYPPSSSSPSPSPSPSPWETGRTRRVSQSTPPPSLLSSSSDADRARPPREHPPPLPPPEVVEVAAASAPAAAADDDDIEDYQLQLALELSAKEDPEAVQIEVAKQISLGSCPVESTPAQVIAYRYWNYNALSYDDKILDGFYDFYGIWDEPTAPNMPSLLDLQEKPTVGKYSWEAVLVNRAEDPDLVKLEQKALIMASDARSGDSAFVGGVLVQRLASLVADYMGGKICEPEIMLSAYHDLSNYLRAIGGNVVLPLGRITIGLARHRALMFKVLADSLEIPCRLVKGKQYTGSEDGALNIVKFDDGREFIVDLMTDPGILIPSDGGTALSREYEQQSLFPANHFNQSNDKSTMNASFLGSSSSVGYSSYTSGVTSTEPRSGETSRSRENEADTTQKLETKLTSTASQTSEAIRRKKKVKDVSKYMINAAKENPKLAQKLHDVLVESGVEAPPDLFSELSAEQLDDQETTSDVTDAIKKRSGPHAPILPNLSHIKPVEGSGTSLSNMPVAAAAVATAAVVASSMVVAAAKSNSEVKFEVPVAAAAATVTAAAVVATTAAVSGNSPIPTLLLPGLSESSPKGSRDDAHEDHHDDGDVDHDKNIGMNEAPPDRSSDKSTGTESTRSDVALDDVAELEIQWEEITLGERIGLGSFGEVYKGDWHGTEVAVKKFLHQDISNDALEEFRSEVRIMKRLRHPNVVLLMGAVTRVPNLSIITEFLPRGSLFRLIHRPNNQLDEKRRLRMALDVARGMNYLHNCTPMVVHRDLKSPNLLVDKNWVVKVCDFGLSRMKHNTFLSSRSTAGTAEWMAPEVLRNEPSDEKCDVFSFGVILWELCTLQQPWEGMNPMQVVGAVGFQHRRLDIPDNMDPVISDIIRECWQTDSKLRPSFSDIMGVLKPLLKTMPNAQAPRQRVPQSDQ
ncbi:protein kinase family protein [Rhynchospora pubera]|uniref:non-specific serine/threonine protein kinase n=1 Tax=Rhynchospora pubera TaxID=906938 RepID=A0AAV8D080_9POAL|nr:protein kinase family protein [Rhynchospora pubera]